jgi:hypothetical protein
MKRTLQIVLVMSFIAIFLISPVEAATSEGFEWGVALNDEFTYHLKMVDEGVTTYDEGLNLTITNTPPSIQDPMPNWLDLPIINVDLVYTNGTPMGIEWLVIGFAAILVGSVLIAPIGNYTLLSELAENSLWWTVNHTVESDSTYWGVRLSGVDDGAPFSISMQYLKSDGVCSRFIIQTTNSTSNKQSSVSLIRDGLGFDIIGLLQDNILLVGIGVGVIVILGAVVCMRRK